MLLARPAVVYSGPLSIARLFESPVSDMLFSALTKVALVVAIALRGSILEAKLALGTGNYEVCLLYCSLHCCRSNQSSL